MYSRVVACGGTTGLAAAAGKGKGERGMGNGEWGIMKESLHKLVLDKT